MAGTRLGTRLPSDGIILMYLSTAALRFAGRLLRMKLGAFFELLEERHAAMVLEWSRRRDPKFNDELKERL